MSTILVITVGGSCQPVVTAINDYRPTHVCFLVSIGVRGSKVTVVGEGKPCKNQDGDKENILTQTGLWKEQYTTEELDDPDSLQDCYAKTQSALSKMMERFPNARYIADYTAGTKSMSAGLVLAALEVDWELSLVKGARTDLVKVVDGSQVAGLVNSWEVRARQRMEEARRLFNDFHYTAAEAILETILQTNPVSTTLQTTIHQWIAFARGLDAWDRFDHQDAMRRLSPYQGQAVPYWLYLKRITGVDAKQHSGYEPVFDLLRNAERRATQGRYDDAVARLYRACELFAQTRLQKRQQSLDSSNLDITLLPDHLHAKYAALSDGGDKKIKLGLRQDYELLVDLGDPVGEVYQKAEKELLNALTSRNHSILAHGLKPLTNVEYRKVYHVIYQLIEQGCSKLNIRLEAPQFPLLVGDALRERQNIIVV